MADSVLNKKEQEELNEVRSFLNLLTETERKKYLESLQTAKFLLPIVREKEKEKEPA